MSTLLKEKNKHTLDERIKFQDKGHKYYIDGDSKDIVSSTSFIHQFFDDFDTDKIIQNILKSSKYNDPNYAYYKMSFTDIKNQWSNNSKVAKEEGTRMHKDIEDFYNDIDVENESSEFKQFLQFYEDHKDLEIYRTEWNIFCEILRLTGSIDAVFINKDGTLSLGDWKRSKDISKESFDGKCGKYPLDHIPDCNYYHYSLQLNLYRVILEKFYGKKVKEMFLVVLHPKNKNEKYIRIDVKNMDKEIHYMLDYRKEELLNKGYEQDELNKVHLNYTLKDLSTTGNPLVDEEDYASEEEIKSFLRNKKTSQKEEKKSFLKTNTGTHPPPKKNQTDPLFNKGKKWTEDENIKLMTEAEKGLDIETLSKIHGRTISALKMRIMQNLLENESKNPAELARAFTQITFEELMSFKEKEHKKTNKSLKKKEETKTVVQSPKKEQVYKEITEDSLHGKQKEAYMYIINGKNVFLTGKAGSGKSLLVRLFHKNYGHSRTIGITSTTGTSAILIGGSTLYSYLGIGIGTGDVEFLYMMIKNRPYILKRWIELDTLIIDEISMLPPDLFDKLEHLARTIRRNDKPFGGIQLILTGDFLQLPVVGSDKFCFESASWEKCVDKVIYLTENFRQGEPEFQECLSEVRVGKLSSESFDLLKSRENVVLVNDLGIKPTKLYALNKNVDAENLREVNKLFTSNPDLVFYEYNLEYEILKKGFKGVDKILNNCNAPNVLELCIGVQVMLLYNMDLDAKLANGSRGVVVRFDHDLPVVRFITGEERIIDHYMWKIQENGTDIMTILQIPLKIAYAVSIHKSQGVTLDYVEIDMEGIFEDGQAYVALSRSSTLKGLSIKNFKVGTIFANRKAVEFYENLE